MGYEPMVGSVDDRCLSCGSDLPHDDPDPHPACRKSEQEWRDHAEQ